MAVDTFDIIFGEKAGNFITKDGKIIFIGGPGSGGGSAGGGTAMTANNAVDLAQGMSDTDLNDALSQAKHEYSEMANERNEFKTVFDRLAERSLTDAQAVNWLSIYPTKIGADVLGDIGKHLAAVSARMDELAPVYRALHDESVFRARGGIH